MWIVYNIENHKLYATFYSKKLAKKFIKDRRIWNNEKQKNINPKDTGLMKYDQWKVWKALQKNYTLS